MQIALDEQELETVRTALDTRLEQLVREWSRTEDRDYRHGLWVTITRLEAIAARLAGREVREFAAPL